MSLKSHLTVLLFHCYKKIVVQPDFFSLRQQRIFCFSFIQVKLCSLLQPKSLLFVLYKTLKDWNHVDPPPPTHLLVLRSYIMRRLLHLLNKGLILCFCICNRKERTRMKTSAMGRLDELSYTLLTT